MSNRPDRRDPEWTQPIEAAVYFTDLLHADPLPEDWIDHLLTENEQSEIERALRDGMGRYTEDDLWEMYIWAAQSKVQAGFVELVCRGGFLITDIQDGKPSVRPDMREIERLAALPYDEYLRTEHWQTVRADALERAGHRCQLCNDDHRLHVHHRTYERRGCEEPEDVIVLCASCHSLFHQIQDGEPTRFVKGHRKRRRR